MDLKTPVRPITYSWTDEILRTDNVQTFNAQNVFGLHLYLNERKLKTFSYMQPLLLIGTGKQFSKDEVKNMALQRFLYNRKQNGPKSKICKQKYSTGTFHNKEFRHR